jgi:hypothetical protein
VSYARSGATLLATIAKMDDTNAVDFAYTRVE